jgi:hypothetical protein
VRTREQEVEPLINLSEITEVELLILKRMREFTIGEHSSMFHGTGFDFVGLRDWQAGDRFEAIDWAQSSLTNFSPLIVREFEQPTTSGVISPPSLADARRGHDGADAPPSPARLPTSACQRFSRTPSVSSPSTRAPPAPCGRASARQVIHRVGYGEDAASGTQELAASRHAEASRARPRSCPSSPTSCSRTPVR